MGREAIAVMQPIGPDFSFELWVGEQIYWRLREILMPSFFRLSDFDFVGMVLALKRQEPEMLR